MKLSKAATAEILKLDGGVERAARIRREGPRASRGKPLKGGSRCGGRAGDQAQPKSIVARSDRKAQTLGDRVFPRLLEHRRALYTKRHLEVLEKAAARFGASLRAARHGQVPVH